MPPVFQVPPVARALKLIAGIIALLPGIAVMLKGIMVPPDLQQFLGGLVTSIGAVIIIIVFLIQKHITNLKDGWIIGICVSSVAVALVCYFIYFVYYGRLYGEWTLPGGTNLRLILPLHPTGELKEWLSSLHSWGAVIAAHPADVEPLVNKQNTSSKALLLGLFVVSFSLSIFAIVLGAWKMAATLRATDSQQPSG